MLSLIGVGTFLFFFGGILRANAYRWRRLAESYAKDTPSVCKRRQTMQTVVLISAGGFNSLKGIVTIGVHDNGVSLSVMPVFSLFHAPLFIPFSDIESGETTWYLNAQSVELSFRKEPDIKLVMSADQLDWISQASAKKITVTHNSIQRPSPTGRWHAFATIHAGISLIMVGCIVWLILSGQLS